MGLCKTSDVLGGNVIYSRSYWDDLRFPAQGINPPGAVSDPDLDTASGTWLFDPGATEILMGVAQLPYAWREGTSIHPHLHWSPTNTNTGNVLWRLEYDIANISDVFFGCTHPIRYPVCWCWCCGDTPKGFVRDYFDDWQDDILHHEVEAIACRRGSYRYVHR